VGDNRAMYTYLTKLTLFLFIGVPLFLGSEGAMATMHRVGDGAGNVSVSVSGSFIAPSCDVQTTSQSVHIGDFYTSDFATTGSVTSAKNFNIKLQNCTSSVKGTKVTFSGAQDANNNTLLALQNSGSAGMASGIGVEILDKNNKTIAINKTDSDLYPLVSGDNSLQLALRYKSTLPTVLEGDASAIMYFDLQYQ